MCGIAGILSRDCASLAEQLAPMIQAQAHRGPDAWGTWIDGPCALGHRRLSIIDLSEGGRQPMTSSDQRLHLTFNGEIYNFQELRTELISLGHTFRSRSDTEVLIAAYQQWGENCLQKLRGMFAFALWDAPNMRLFLARDRVGKKPLFYSLQKDRFVFASELQGVLAAPGISREIDLSAIDAYLSYGYVPAPRTAFRAVKKLLPGNSMVIEFGDSALTAKHSTYWELQYLPKLAITEEEAIERLREKLSVAVRIRMISDVPLGTFLSGGIDSSIVVGLMAKQSASKVKTFSIGFKESEYNELDHARRIATKWDTEHHEFIVEPDALEILPVLVRHYGEPYADSSAIPTYYVSQLTRRHVTVALNGDGGDESFAGYERYLGNQVAEQMQAVPGIALAARALSRIIPDSIHPKSRMRHAHRFLAVAAQPMAERYPRWLTFFDPAAKRRLLHEDFSDALNTLDGETQKAWLQQLFDRQKGLDPIDAAMSVDIQSYLPYDLLVKVDIATMANGLEARSPFLDHEVMEFAARLPGSIKTRGRVLKHLLKKAFADLLPPENVNRRKMGFGVPVGRWFRGPLRSFLIDTLLDERSRRRGYFQMTEVERTVREHTESRADHSFSLWNLLMLELWHREFIDE
jgi:asparagine synthase (glutamine-hydrolysing)